MAVNIVRRGFLAGLAGAAMLTPGVAAQQSTNVAALHAKVHKHLVIRNAMVIYGNRRPPSGPFDIVIDDGSPQPLSAPATLAPGGTPVVFVRQANTGPAGARNRGLAEARGEFVAFIDDDCQADARWLETLITALQSRPGAAVGGTVVNALDRNPFAEASQILVSFVRDYYNGEAARTRFFTTNNLAFPREALSASGAFAEEYVRALAGREVLTREVDAALGQHDALVLPTLPIPAPVLGASTVEVEGKTESIRNVMLRLTQLFDVTGHPAIAIPMGMTTAGLPTSLQLVGGRQQTDALLRVALACEKFITK